MKKSENMEIYFDCQALPSDDEMDGDMAFSMPENYIVLSNYFTISTELLMSHMGDTCRNNRDTNQGLMDQTETKTKFYAKCMWQIQHEKVDKNKKRNTVSILSIFPFYLLFKKKKTAECSLKFNCAFRLLLWKKC